MQQNLLPLGATSHLGRKIAEGSQGTTYRTIAVVRSKGKGELLKPFVLAYKVADVLELRELSGICKNISVVVSDLGKPISPNSKDKPSCLDVDYKGKLNVLKEAVKSGVRKFVYVSKVYTRREITQVIRHGVAPQRKFHTTPTGLVKFFLPVVKLFYKNSYDKIAFFMRVMEEDTLADRAGQRTLKEYVADYVRSQNNVATPRHRVSLL